MIWELLLLSVVHLFLMPDIDNSVKNTEKHMASTCLCKMKYKDDTVDSPTPLNKPLSAYYRRSFAFVTVKDRLPVILTQVVDHLARDKEKIIQEYGEGAREELKIIIGSFSQLKNEVQTNKELKPLQSNGSDIPIWNSYLENEVTLKQRPQKWFDSDWLFSECFMYRKAREIFELSQSLNSYDPFRVFKEEALVNATNNINIVSEFLKEELERASQLNETDVRKVLQSIVYLDLWGNRCDLSLSAGATVIMEENPLFHAEKFNEFILVDDSDQIWTTLSESGKNNIVDIVLDNAGYELFTDLCVADYLVTTSLANKVRFYVKSIPWYVSDTMDQDFHYTIKTLISSGSESAVTLATRWKQYIDSEKWTIEVEDFWTLPHSFDKMKEVRPDLYAKLSQSSLVIFKGDLNYRKLVGDINWPPTEPFASALRGFEPTNIIALRTVKADTISGLQPGQAEATAARDSDWLLTGKYAVIQFHKRP